jgi:hypothetical protein
MSSKQQPITSTPNPIDSQEQATAPDSSQPANQLALPDQIMTQMNDLIANSQEWLAYAHEHAAEPEAVQSAMVALNQNQEALTSYVQNAGAALSGAASMIKEIKSQRDNLARDFHYLESTFDDQLSEAVGEEMEYMSNGDPFFEEYRTERMAEEIAFGDGFDSVKEEARKELESRLEDAKLMAEVLIEQKNKAPEDRERRNISRPFVPSEGFGFAMDDEDDEDLDDTEDGEPDDTEDSAA